MDIGLKAERTFDIALVWQIINHPEIMECISEDGLNQHNPDVIREFWVAIFNDQDVIGIYNIHQIYSKTWQIHAHILPQHRDYAKESGRVILRWALGHIQFNKLQAIIPDLYPNVYHFTLGQGFKDEGLMRESYFKNGDLYDQHILGISRDEIEVQLSE